MDATGIFEWAVAVIAADLTIVLVAVAQRRGIAAVSARRTVVVGIAILAGTMAGFALRQSVTGLSPGKCGFSHEFRSSVNTPGLRAEAPR